MWVRARLYRRARRKSLAAGIFSAGSGDFTRGVFAAPAADGRRSRVREVEAVNRGARDRGEGWVAVTLPGIAGSS